MDTDEFWSIVGTARSKTTEDLPFHEALVDLLARRSPQDILRYQERFDALRDAVYRWDVWAAAYLIGGGCSDDSFMDFRAGLIAQGRDWYERAAAVPDSLADHAEVIGAAADFEDRTLFYEDANYCASDAYERITGDGEAFYEAWEQYRAAHPGPGPTEPDMGEDFDFDDDDEMRRRLPRLALLFLSEKAVDRTPTGS
ncbi:MULTISPECIES: DUF4240 domain-containing protein [unclassified Streptomyces]|uniref:DUF4240 domain-containing protein n=1 Tax=unclassified Streptomyces TaxID=2593676 RepID=UPI00224D46F5|nr:MULTISPECIES: DUF4240 domain-containing protein [unclassified Streptomyces]MCX5333301.1 DUF4240 domain-containing protein [Streptomyces sp. NBC_00140]MCX5362719.1 DUF4240 domain-containing protein [Streptomyces sp. NBC_00124]